MSREAKGEATGLTESELVKRLVTYLVDCGYRVRTEVPNMGQSADVVATRSRWVTFIEAKTRDWRRALRQCQAHEQVADFVCIAIATASVSETLREEVEDAGYGLIHCPPFDYTCRWVVTPTRNTCIWSPQRGRLSKALRAIDYEH